MKKTLIFILILVLYESSSGQGCSDAGFCTAGSVKPDMLNEQFKNNLGFTVGYGIGEQGTTVFTPQFEPQFKIKDKGMVQIKVPFVNVKGKLGNTNGLGDIVFTYNYQLDSQFKKPITLTLGTRIGTGTSNLKSSENISLPMPYQVSLGTTDIILGAKLQLNKSFSLALGFQQPILNKNQNGFDSMAFKAFGAKHNLKTEDNYFISSNLKRKGDVMLRLDYTKTFKKSLLTLGLLPIYHLGMDQITQNKTKEEVKNSAGLTLNLNGAYYHSIGSKTELSFIAASPLLVRESRPDGLTRALVLVAGVRYLL